MIKRFNFCLHISLLVLLVSVSAACSLANKKTEYESTTEDRPLEVPPDLSEPGSEEALRVPAIKTQDNTYSAYTRKPAIRTPGDVQVLPQEEVKPDKGMRFIRDGSLFWLEIDAPPDVIWPEAKGFLRNVGFKVTVDAPELGYMETDWLESKVVTSANWFGKLMNKIYETGLRDMYRIRLERSTQDPNLTLLFITHRGLKEIYSEDNNLETVTTVGWAPRDPDPGLEVEMLERFMVYRGLAEAEAQKMTAGAFKERSVLREGESGSYLLVNESYARTWRRIGIALDRMGMIVEDRNRAGGVYYLRLPESFTAEQEKGWFSSLFSSDDKEEKETQQFLLTVEDKGGSTAVRIAMRQGETQDPKMELQILSQLQVHLR